MTLLGLTALPMPLFVYAVFIMANFGYPISTTFGVTVSTAICPRMTWVISAVAWAKRRAGLIITIRVNNPISQRPWDIDHPIRIRTRNIDNPNLVFCVVPINPWRSGDRSTLLGAKLNKRPTLLNLATTIDVGVDEILELAGFG